MNADSLTQLDLNKISINKVDPRLVKDIVRTMRQNMPHWLSSSDKILPELSAPSRIVFAASYDNEYLGLIAISSITSHNLHIDYLMISQPNLLLPVGKKLLYAAEKYCLEAGFASLTIETLSPKKNEASDEFKIFHFFEKAGYKPLVEYLQGNNVSVVLMHKVISLNDFTFIDLTHSISSDVPHWGLDAGFKYNARYIQSNVSDDGVKFRVQRLEMSAGIGTHLDAPSHCFENAPSVSDIPLQSLITTCRVINVSNKAHDLYSVTPDDVLHFEAEFGCIPKSSFVIIYTGWDQRWTQPEKYRNEKIFPNISVEAAKILLSRDIVGLGIDTLSPDAFGSNFPVHQLILGAGKFIVENVANAHQLDPGDAYVFALPIKVADGTEAPMRLVGLKRKRIFF